MVWQDALHEEADNRILVHVKDMMVQDDCKSIQIRTVDTDVVVIMLAFMPYLMLGGGITYFFVFFVLFVFCFFQKTTCTITKKTKKTKNSF